MADNGDKGVTLPAFRNESYLDFATPANQAGMLSALASVRMQLGRHYGERSGERLVSTNPARPDEIVGTHAAATRQEACEAVDAAYAAFAAYSRTPAGERVEALIRAAELLRARRLTFNAWLTFEAGKTWAEADAETCEAIDFCEYYAREMARFMSPPPLVQLQGERGEARYIALGVGVIIPPWNFPLAILAGMTVAALVAGNTVVIKPSSETPTIAALFVELLLEAGFPEEAIRLLPGPGSVIGDVLVSHPLTRFVSFTGSRDVGLRINELAATRQPGQRWIKRVVAEMGGKDAIVIDSECDLTAAVEGVAASAFGYSGQKCSACSRAIVHRDVYPAFLEALRARVERIPVGDPADFGNYMGPVISAGAKRGILEYIEIGKQEGILISGGSGVSTPGHYVAPTVFANVPAGARIFQEEIFGPVLAVTRAEDFEQALAMANDSPYGLTGAVYSNNGDHLDLARREFFVGNLYLNRKCTGAMVGAHPFGGFNMSGTDSKAGGPDYLHLFLQAKSIAEKLA